MIAQAPPGVRAFGATQGALMVYFHGVPGGAAECARFDALARANGVRLVCIDRSAVATELSGEAYLLRLAGVVDTVSKGKPFALIGFSIGAAMALRTLPHLSNAPEHLHLISAAGPLNPSLLADMAGRAVFRAAQRSQRDLTRLTRVQAWLSRHAPSLLFRMVFSAAAGADRALARDASFRAWIGGILRSSLTSGAAAYQRDLQLYVGTWPVVAPPESTATRLWHGDQDNWSPPRMADALLAGLGPHASLQWLKGRSHYSGLFDAMPRILAESALPPENGSVEAETKGGGPGPVRRRPAADRRRPHPLRQPR